MKLFRFIFSCFATEKTWLLLGMLLGFLTLLAGLGLFSLSGWLISAAALAGLSASSALAFNYLLPAAGVRFFSLCRILARYGERVVTHDASFRVLRDLRVWAYQKLEPLSPLQWMSYQSGDALHHVVNDVDALNQLSLRVFLPVILALLLCLSLWIYLSFFQTKLALAIFVVLLGSLILLPLLAHQLGRRLSNLLYQNQKKQQIAWLEVLQGVKELHIFGGIKTKLAHIFSLNHALGLAQKKMAGIKGLLLALLSLLSGILIIGLIFFAGGLVLAQHLLGPILALMIFAIMAGYEAISPLPFAFQFFRKTLISASRLQTLANETPSISFPETSREIPREASLHFEKLYFHYPNRPDTLIFENFSLHLAAHEKLGIYGPSGCGKSTLVHLLTRSADPQAGEIYLGKVKLKNLSEGDLRRQMSVMTQHPYLFNLSLRENLLLGNPQADDAELWQALEKVNLATVVQKFSQGLDTYLGEQGSRLSGGQARRVALARIILQNAPIWILDEPTESLDPRTREKLLETLAQVWTSKTVIFISHRESDLKDMRQLQLKVSPR